MKTTANSSIWVNGKQSETISALDRGIQFGQNVFETISIFEGELLLLNAHLERLNKGCKRLQIPVDLKRTQEEIINIAKQFDKAILRLTMTMGPGERGYQNPTKPNANRIVSISDYPTLDSSYWSSGITLGLSTVELANQPLLAGLKHGNRLEQVMARQQWQEGWQEALMLDSNKNVIEGTQSNVFIVSGEQLITPDLNQCGIAGVMREFILQNAHKCAFEPQIMRLSVDDVKQADEVFLSNSVIGLWPVKQFQEAVYLDFTASNKLLKLMQDHGAIPTI